MRSLSNHIKTTLRDYQQEIVDQTWDKEYWAYLLDMGLGKTLVTLTVAAKLYDAGAINGMIVVAPSGVHTNWCRKEIPAHFDKQAPIASFSWDSKKTGTQKYRNEFKEFSAFNGLRVLSMNIDAVRTKKGLQAIQWFCRKMRSVMMAIDESIIIKNHNATQTKMMTALARMEEVKYRRILTGNPITNSPMDVYSQYLFLSPDALGVKNVTVFRNLYTLTVMEKIEDAAGRVKRIMHECGARNEARLSESMGKCSTRLKKEECIDLPDKIYSQRYVSMTPEQEKAYREMATKLATEFDGQETTAEIAMTKLMRLNQILNGHFTSDEKVVTRIPSSRALAVLDIINENPGQKFIVWGVFREDLEIISELLKTKKINHVLYHGGIGDAERTENIRKFQENPETRVFLSNRTASRGLTLTAANVCIYYSNYYSWDIRSQSEDRAHRIGQTRNVVYVDLICPGTIDEKIIEALKSKKTLSGTVLDVINEIKEKYSR